MDNEFVLGIKYVNEYKKDYLSFEGNLAVVEYRPILNEWQAVKRRTQPEINPLEEASKEVEKFLDSRHESYIVLTRLPDFVVELPGT